MYFIVDLFENIRLIVLVFDYNRVMGLIYLDDVGSSSSYLLSLSMVRTITIY